MKCDEKADFKLTVLRYLQKTYGLGASHAYGIAQPHWDEVDNMEPQAAMHAIANLAELK